MTTTAATAITAVTAMSTRPCTPRRRLTAFTLVLIVASTLGSVGCGSNRARSDDASVRLPPKHVHRPAKPAVTPGQPIAASAPASAPMPAWPQFPRIKNDSVL